MSAEQAAPAKLCTVCGIDCSKIPRIKDQQGRYICKECFDKAKQTKQVLKNPPVPGPAVPAAVAAAPTEGDNSFLLDLGSKESTGLSGTKPCPECGRALPTNAVICIGCGYNLTTGKRLPVKVSKEKVKAEKGSSGGASFMDNGPLLAGIVCLIQPAAAALAFVDKGLGAVAFGISILIAIVIGVLVLVGMFQDGLGWGLSALLLTFFFGLGWLLALIWVFFICEDSRLKWLFAGNLVGGILCSVVLFALAGIDPQHMF